MSLRAIRWTAMVAAAAVMAAVSAAGAASPPYTVPGLHYSVSFSPNTPATSSSLTFTVASPMQPQSTIVAFPTGTQLNLKAVPRCSTPPTCDPSTQVGTGSASVHYKQYTIPVAFGMFNRPGGLAIILNVPNGKPVVVSPTWSGSKLIIPYPNGLYKGLPIVTVKISLTFSQIGSGRHALIRTPSKCPKGGWPSAAIVSFSGGVGVLSNASAKCQVKKPKHKKKKHKKKKK